MHIQPDYFTATNVSEIYSIETDEIISNQHRPHFYTILLLNAEQRTVVSISKVASIFNEQHLISAVQLYD